MNKSDKIYVAGHNGMVGSAIVRQLQKNGFTTLLTRSSKELDLTNQAAVNRFFETEKQRLLAKRGGKFDEYCMVGVYLLNKRLKKLN